MMKKKGKLYFCIYVISSMDRESFIQERRRKAMEYFHRGYNCSQSVMLTFCDIIGLDEETALKTASGLGGGMGRMREVCGCVSAMAAVSGFLIPATDPEDKIARKENYALVQNLAGRFKEKNGSIVCRELLKLRVEGWQNPEPSARSEEYYAARPCERLVGDAAEILAACLADRRL